MTNHENRWSAVGREIADRIESMGVTWAELHQRSGISYKTWQRYIHGAPIVRVDKRRELVKALGWTLDSIQRILDGKPPLPAPSSSGVEHPGSVADVEQLYRAETEDVLASLDALQRDGGFAEFSGAVRNLRPEHHAALLAGGRFDMLGHVLWVLTEYTHVVDTNAADHRSDVTRLRVEFDRLAARVDELGRVVEQELGIELASLQDDEESNATPDESGPDGVARPAQ